MERGHKQKILAPGIFALVLLAWGSAAYALNPALDASQYAHTAWTVRDGFSIDNIFAMAQTPDGYLWFGTEFGLFRFDGVRAIPWQPPSDQHLPDRNITALLATRDGTLWIGSFVGLVSWDGAKLTRYAELDGQVVQSLLEDRDGTVLVGGMAAATVGAAGRLCAIRRGSAHCDSEDGAFGRTVWALYADNSGTVWAAADSGLWRWKPGPARRYLELSKAPAPGYSPFRAIDVTNADDGRLLMAMRGAGLMQLAGGKLEPYPVQGANNSSRLLRDRDGGLWIGTADRGLIHVHRGRTDVFSRSSGLSGNGIFTLFEDREGNVWVSTNGGLDRFRESPVTTISVEQGLSSDATQSVLAARDGAIWIGTQGGLNRWKDGQVTVYRTASGVPDDVPQSMFQDDGGRIWVFTRHGLAYFRNGRFVAINGVPGGDVHFIAGDAAGNLWLSEGQSLLHLRDEHLVEQISWPELGRRQGAGLVLSDPARGGLWLGFWDDGGVSYFKDGRVRESYTEANGLGKGQIGYLQLDSDGTLWAATQAGGLSRIKDGRIASLTSRNGLPCDTIHWSTQDDVHSLWLYTACGLLRIPRTELDAWIADPNRRIQTTVWSAADGVRLRSTPGSPYGPRVAKSNDGKLWFVTGEGVQVVDPRHLTTNELPPPVHIEQITADHKTYWQNSNGGAASSPPKLPPMVRDLTIDYTALTFVAPEKVHFRFKLEGQDRNWREVVNDREVQYSNLAPGNYRFHVTACNNSGVWNQEGATLNFSVAPAYWQTNWFRSLCVLAIVAILWTAYRVRVRVLEARQAILERHQAEISALNQRIMRAQEEERMRIAGDLHDSVLQQITSIALELATATIELPTDSQPKAEVRAVEKKLIEVGAEIRQLSHELHPTVLQEAGLPAALSAYCEEFSKLRGISIAYHAEESVEELSPGAALCIYRIAQEALGNVSKHAQANRVEVRLSRSDGRVCLVVSDDGVGFNPDGSGKGGGLGLINMRERVHQLNGTFEFESKPERGTTVKVEIPFRPAS